MTERSFSLIPFPAPALPDIKITGSVARQGNVLAVQYLLIGNLEEVTLPPRSAQRSRKDDLWKMTCFEFFLAIRGQPQYWEFNLSPSGDWNVYRMDAYRRLGFREEMSIQQMQFDLRKAANVLTLNAVVELSPLFQQSDSLAMGITAVIQTKGADETYWALTHPALQADFHLRESFILPLEAQTHPSGQPAPGA